MIQSSNFNNPITRVRGEFIVKPSQSAVNVREGLTLEISIDTETEHDLDVDIDEDFYVCEKIIIAFRGNRAGWGKAYRRLRQQFKARIRYVDQQKAPTLATRLRHHQMVKQFRAINQGDTACAS